MENVMEQIKRYDLETYEHCKRTAALAEAVGMYSDLDAETLRQAALVHDVGKMFVDPEILHKPGRLTDEERATMDTHSLRGYEYLKQEGVEDKVCILVLFHHGIEKVPEEYHHLAKDMEAEIQVMKSIDVFDALTSARPYHEAIPEEKAYSIMEEEHCRKEAIEVIKKLKMEDRV